MKLGAIIESFVRPVVYPQEYGGNSDMIAMLMARCLIDRGHDVPMNVVDSFGAVYQMFGNAVCAQCPGLDPKKALEKLVLSTGAVFMFQSFSGLAKAREEGAVFLMDDHLNDALAFCEAGFNS